MGFGEDGFLPLLFLCWFSRENRREKRRHFICLETEEEQLKRVKEEEKKTLSFECQFLPTIIDTRRLEQVRAE